MYYSAWDKQCGWWFNTGRNSESRTECVHNIWQYMVED